MITVINTIQVKPGYGGVIEERFRTPKDVHTFPGFVRLELLRTEDTDGYEEYRVCTTWESKADFERWVESDSFKMAHERRQQQPSDMILGNKVTFHEVVVTHLPAAQAGE